MANPVDSLPADVVEAWKSGNKMEAIKRLREATRLGLAEAKAAVDALDHAADGSSRVTLSSQRIASGQSFPDMMKALQESGALPPDVMEAWQRGAKLEALKRFAAAAKEGRIQGNMKVKVTVDERRSPAAVASRSPSLLRSESAETPMPGEGLAPGEVPRSNNGAAGALVVIAIVVIALMAYARYA